jgi:hypothetical protein
MADASALASAAVERRKASGPSARSAAVPDGAANWLVRLSALRLPSFGWRRIICSGVQQSSDAYASRRRASSSLIRPRDSGGGIRAKRGRRGPLSRSFVVVANVREWGSGLLQCRSETWDEYTSFAARAPSTTLRVPPPPLAWGRTKKAEPMVKRPLTRPFICYGSRRRGGWPRCQ